MPDVCSLPLKKEDQKLSLGCENLDSLMSGGVSSGIVTNFFGAPAAGKTNIVTQLAVNTIRNGKQVIFIDTEGGFSPERFLQMHSEEDALSKIILLEPSSFDEQDHKIRTLETFFKKDHNIGLVVMDSLVSLYRLHNGSKTSDTVQNANQRLSQQLAALARIAKEKNIPVVVTNQIYEDFDKKEVQLVGRDVPKYACKDMVYLEKSVTGKRRATLSRHRYLPEGEKAEFFIVDSGLKDKKGIF